MLYLHNVSRAQHTRAQRYAAATHRGIVQRIHDKVIHRGRPAPVSEQWVQEHKDLLLSRIQAGLLEVRDANGRMVNLTTGELTIKQLFANELPVETLDSINNDSPHIGRPVPLFPGGALQSVAQPPAPAEEPAPLAEDVEEGGDEVPFVEAKAESQRTQHKKGRR